MNANFFLPLISILNLGTLGSRINGGGGLNKRVGGGLEHQLKLNKLGGGVKISGDIGRFDKIKKGLFVNEIQFSH